MKRWVFDGAGNVYLVAFLHVLLDDVSEPFTLTLAPIPHDDAMPLRLLLSIAGRAIPCARSSK